MDNQISFPHYESSESLIVLDTCAWSRLLNAETAAISWFRQNGKSPILPITAIHELLGGYPERQFLLEGFLNRLVEENIYYGVCNYHALLTSSAQFEIGLTRFELMGVKRTEEFNLAHLFISKIIEPITSNSLQRIADLSGSLNATATIYSLLKENYTAGRFSQNQALNEELGLRNILFALIFLFWEKKPPFGLEALSVFDKHTLISMCAERARFLLCLLLFTERAFCRKESITENSVSDFLHGALAAYYDCVLDHKRCRDWDDILHKCREHFPDFYDHVHSRKIWRSADFLISVNK